MKLREVAKNFIQFKVSDGSRVFLWYDYWHHAGCLLEKFGFWALYDSRSSVGFKLSTIICNGEWFWPCARFDSVVEIQSRLPEVDIGIADLPLICGIPEWNLLLCKNLREFENKAS